MKLSGMGKVALVALLCLALTGCNATTQRAFKGGVIGAGVGAAGAAVTGGSVQRGALIGGGAGTAIGAAW